MKPIYVILFLMILFWFFAVIFTALVSDVETNVPAPVYSSEGIIETKEYQDAKFKLMEQIQADYYEQSK